MVDHLHDRGWEVVALDQAAPVRAGIASTQVDLTDFGQAYEALAGIDDRHDGVDALVHLPDAPVRSASVLASPYPSVLLEPTCKPPPTEACSPTSRPCTSTAATTAN